MIVTGLLALLLNLAFLQSNAEPVVVAVARTSLDAGRVLDESSVDMVEVRDVGDLDLLTESNATALFGSLLARRVEEGEPLRRSDVRPAGTAAGLREFSVVVDNSAASGGLIQPSDMVDVIATIENRSFYVRGGLEVVTVSREGTGLDVGDELIIVLSVDDRTALELASAQAAGSITLVRSTGAAPPSSGPVDFTTRGNP